MSSYNEDKIRIRPSLPQLIISDKMSNDEQFQNESLRPILKMQHEVIELIVQEFIQMKKNEFYKLSKEKRPSYIKDNLLSDKMIIHELRGMVMGFFTTEEMKYYIENKATINKRIQSLLLQRISSFLLS